MKKYILLTLMFFGFSVIATSQYLQLKISNSGNQVVVTGRAHPGGGNVTVGLGWSSFELFFYYPNSITPNFGTLTGTAQFPTYIASTALWQDGPNYGSFKTKWLLCGQSVQKTNIVFTDGQEYELFRFELTGVPSYNDITFIMDYGTLQVYNAWYSFAGNVLDPFYQGYTNYTTDPPYYPTYTTVPTNIVLASPFANMPMENFMWTGDAGDNDWANVNNWSSFTLPSSSNNTVIPPSRTYYPETNSAGTPTGTTNNLDIQTGAHVYLPPAKNLTVSGTLNVTDAQSFRVLATTSGVGSLITLGSITYGASGSANVQSYIKNSASPGNFYAHLVGPTIDDPATGFSGVYLQAFNLPVSTYAYEYLESSNSWSNVSLITTPVGTTKGILLSTATTGDQTMTMTGSLITGAIASAALQHGGTNDNDLLSNPYPSALNFNVFYAANSSNITNKYYLWDPSGTGTYVFYIISGGGTLTKDIQVGQGFFVETLSTSPANFDNTMRLHSTVLFLKDTYAYQLRLNLEGNGFKDATFIYFKDEGTSGYDQLHDVYKWWSMYPEASELWTIANDESQLSMNSLPPLGSTLVNVPMSFKCGAEGSYSITAENIASFDEGTQIFLEDLVAGGEWYDLVANPVYEFTAEPQGLENRFIVHFFGPTGINDPVGPRLIQIYGYGHDAYIVNRGRETVKEYVAYDLMGREIQRGTLPNSTVNKVTIGDVSAYYIVKVITKEGRIYTDKVYINK